MSSNSVTNYLSNVMHSVKFAALEVVEEQMPITGNFITQNKEVVKQIFKDVLDSRQTLMKTFTIQDNIVFKKANEMFRNIKTDLKTGKFYHEDRGDPMEMMSMMGSLMEGFGDAGGMGDMMGELNAILNGDFDDEEGMEEEGQPVYEQHPERLMTRGDALVASAIFKSQSRATNSIGRVIASIHEHDVSDRHTIYNMQFQQSEKSLMIQRTGWSTMVDGFNKIIEFNNDVMRTHVENSQKFYEEMLKTVQDSNSILHQLHDIQTKVHKFTLQEEKEGDDDPDKENIDYENLFKNGLNIAVYKDIVTKRVAKTPLAQIVNLSKALPMMLMNFTQSPLHELAKQVIKGVIGGQMMYAMKRFDEVVESAISTGLARLYDYSRRTGTGMKGEIAKIFGIKLEQKNLSSIDTSKYQKDSMSWNGIAQKALVEVIPSHLARIEGSLTGNGERYFDFDKGKWNSIDDLKYKIEKLDKNIMDIATAPIEDKIVQMKAMLDKMVKDKKIDNKQRENMERSLNKAIMGVIKHGSLDPAHIKSDPLAYGVEDKNDPSLPFIYTFLNLINRHDARRMTKPIYDANMARNRQFEQAGKGSGSILTNLINNSMVGMVEARPGFNASAGNASTPLADLTQLRDERGKTLYDYQDLILMELYKIRNLGGFGGGGTGAGPTPPEDGNGLSREELEKKIEEQYRAGIGAKKEVKKTDANQFVSTIADELRREREEKERAKKLAREKRFEAYGTGIKDEDEKKLLENMKSFIGTDVMKQLYELGPDGKPLVDADGNKVLNKTYEALLETFTKYYDLRERKAQERNVRHEESTFFSWLNPDSWEWIKKGEENYHKLPDGISPDMPFLDQLLKAGTIGQKFDVIRHNIDAFRDAPTTMLAAVLGQAEKAIDYVLFEKESGIDPKTGKPIHGVFDKLTTKLDEHADKANGFLDSIVEGIKDLFKEDGLLSILGDFVKDKTGIDIKTMGSSAKGEFSKFLTGSLAGVKSMGWHAYKMGARAIAKVIDPDTGRVKIGTNNQLYREGEIQKARELVSAGKFTDVTDAQLRILQRENVNEQNFNADYIRNKREEQRAEQEAAWKKAREGFDNEDEEPPPQPSQENITGAAYGLKYGLGTKTIAVSPGEAYIPADGSKGIKNIPRYGFMKVSPGDTIINANENPYNPRKGTYNLESQAANEQHMINSTFSGSNTLGKLASKFIDTYAKGGKVKNYKLTHEEADTIQLIDTLAKAGYTATEINQIIDAKPEDRSKLISDIIEKRQKDKDFTRKQEYYMRTAGGYIKSTLEGILRGNESGFRLVGKGVKEDAKGNIVLGDKVRRDRLKGFTDSRALGKVTYKRRNRLRGVARELGVGDMIESDEMIDEKKLSSKEGPITGIRQFINQMFGTDPRKAVILTKDFMIENAFKIGKGSAIGALLGTVFPLGGPLMGALIGAGFNTIKDNEKLNEYLFGKLTKNKDGKSERDNSGLFSKETQKAYEEYAPGIKKWGMLGAIGGLILPFGPLGGALIGAGASVINNNARMHEMLFGKEGGLLNEDRKKRLKKALPHIATATLSTFFLGPFGLLGSAAIGTGLGLLSTTEMFKKLMLGPKGKDGTRRGGLAGVFRDQIIDPLKSTMEKFKTDFADWFKDKLFNPISDGMKKLGRVGFSLGKSLMTTMGKKIGNFLYGRMSGFLPKFLVKVDSLLESVRKSGGWIQFILKKLFKRPLEWVSEKIQGAGNAAEEWAIRKGFVQDYSAKEAALIYNRMGKEDRKSNQAQAIRNIANMDDIQLAALNKAASSYSDSATGRIAERIGRMQNRNIDNLYNNIEKSSKESFEAGNIDADQKANINSWAREFINEDTFKNLLNIKDATERREAIDNLLSRGRIPIEMRKKIASQLITAVKRYSKLKAREDESKNGTYLNGHIENMRIALGLKDASDEEISNLILDKGIGTLLQNEVSSRKRVAWDKQQQEPDKEKSVQGPMEKLEEAQKDNSDKLDANTKALIESTAAIINFGKYLTGIDPKTGKPLMKGERVRYQDLTEEQKLSMANVNEREKINQLFIDALEKQYKEGKMADYEAQDIFDANSSNPDNSALTWMKQIGIVGAGMPAKTILRGTGRGLFKTARMADKGASWAQQHARLAAKPLNILRAIPGSKRLHVKKGISGVEKYLDSLGGKANEAAIRTGYEEEMKLLDMISNNQLFTTTGNSTLLDYFSLPKTASEKEQQALAEQFSQMINQSYEAIKANNAKAKSISAGKQQNVETKQEEQTKVDSSKEAEIARLLDQYNKASSELIKKRRLADLEALGYDTSGLKNVEGHAFGLRGIMLALKSGKEAFKEGFDKTYGSVKEKSKTVIKDTERVIKDKRFREEKKDQFKKFAAEKKEQAKSSMLWTMAKGIGRVGKKYIKRKLKEKWEQYKKKLLGPLYKLGEKWRNFKQFIGTAKQYLRQAWEGIKEAKVKYYGHSWDEFKGKIKKLPTTVQQLATEQFGKGIAVLSDALNEEEYKDLFDSMPPIIQAEMTKHKEVDESEEEDDDYYYREEDSTSSVVSKPKESISHAKALVMAKKAKSGDKDASERLIAAGYNLDDLYKEIEPKESTKTQQQTKKEVKPAISLIEKLRELQKRQESEGSPSVQDTTQEPSEQKEEISAGRLRILVGKAQKGDQEAIMKLEAAGYNADGSKIEGHAFGLDMLKGLDKSAMKQLGSKAVSAIGSGLKTAGKWAWNKTKDKATESFTNAKNKVRGYFGLSPIEATNAQRGDNITYYTNEQGQETKEITTSEGDIITMVKTSDGWSQLPSKENIAAQAKLDHKKELQERQTNALEKIAEKLGVDTGKAKDKEKGNGLLDMLKSLLKSPLAFLGSLLSSAGSLLLKPLLKGLGGLAGILGKGLAKGLGGVTKVIGVLGKGLATVLGGLTSILLKNKKIALGLAATGFIGKKIYNAFFGDSPEDTAASGGNASGNGERQLSKDEELARSFENGDLPPEIKAILAEETGEGNDESHPQQQGKSSNKKQDDEESELESFAMKTGAGLAGGSIGASAAGHLSPFLKGTIGKFLGGGIGMVVAERAYDWYNTGELNTDNLLSDMATSGAEVVALNWIANKMGLGDTKDKRLAAAKKRRIDRLLDVVKNTNDKSKKYKAIKELKKLGYNFNRTKFGQSLKIITKIKNGLDTFKTLIMKVIPSGNGRLATAVKGFFDKAITRLTPEIVQPLLKKISQRALTAMLDPIGYGISIYLGTREYFNCRDRADEMFQVPKGSSTEGMKFLAGIAGALPYIIPGFGALLALIWPTEWTLKLLITMVGPFCGADQVIIDRLRKRSNNEQAQQQQESEPSQPNERSRAMRENNEKWEQEAQVSVSANTPKEQQPKSEWTPPTESAWKPPEPVTNVPESVVPQEEARQLGFKDYDKEEIKRVQEQASKQVTVKPPVALPPDVSIPETTIRLSGVLNGDKKLFDIDIKLDGKTTKTSKPVDNAATSTQTPSATNTRYNTYGSYQTMGSTPVYTNYGPAVFVDQDNKNPQQPKSAWKPPVSVTPPVSGFGSTPVITNYGAATYAQGGKPSFEFNPNIRAQQYGLIASTPVITNYGAATYAQGGKPSFEFNPNIRAQQYGLIASTPVITNYGAAYIPESNRNKPEEVRKEQEGPLLIAQQQGIVNQSQVLTNYGQAQFSKYYKPYEEDTDTINKTAAEIILQELEKSIREFNDLSGILDLASPFQAVGPVIIFAIKTLVDKLHEPESKDKIARYLDSSGKDLTNNSFRKNKSALKLLSEFDYGLNHTSRIVDKAGLNLDPDSLGVRHSIAVYMAVVSAFTKDERNLLLALYGTSASDYDTACLKLIQVLCGKTEFGEDDRKQAKEPDKPMENTISRDIEENEEPRKHRTFQSPSDSYMKPSLVDSLINNSRSGELSAEEFFQKESVRKYVDSSAKTIAEILKGLVPEQVASVLPGCFDNIVSKLTTDDKLNSFLGKAQNAESLARELGSHTIDEAKIKESFLNGSYDTNILDIPVVHATVSMRNFAGIVSALLTGIYIIKQIMSAKEFVDLCLNSLAKPLGFSKADISKLKQSIKDKEKTRDIASKKLSSNIDAYNKSGNTNSSGNTAAVGYNNNSGNTNSSSNISATQDATKKEVKAAEQEAQEATGNATATKSTNTNTNDNKTNSAPGGAWDKIKAAGSWVKNKLFGSSKYGEGVLEDKLEFQAKKKNRTKPILPSSGMLSNSNFLSLNTREAAAIPFTRSGDTRNQSLRSSGCGVGTIVNTAAGQGIGLDQNKVANKAKLTKEKDGGTPPSEIKSQLSNSGLDTKNISGIVSATKALQNHESLAVMGKYGSNTPHWMSITGMSKDGKYAIVQDSDSNTPNRLYDLRDTIKNSSFIISAKRGTGKKNTTSIPLKGKSKKYGRAKYGTGMDFDPNNSELKERTDYAWAWLTNKGFKPEGAAAAIGNALAESCMDPQLVEVGFYFADGTKVTYDNNHADRVDKTNMKGDSYGSAPPGYGIFQFTDVPEKQGLIDYAKSKSLPEGSIEAQLGALEYHTHEVPELKYRKPNWDYVKDNPDGKNAEDLATYFMQKLEIPNMDPPYYGFNAERRKYSKHLYDYYKDKKLENVKDPTGSGVASSSSNGGSSTSGGQQGGQNQNPFARFMQFLSNIINPFGASWGNENNNNNQSQGTTAGGGSVNYTGGGQGLNNAIGEGYDGGSPMGKVWRISVHNVGGDGTVEDIDSFHRRPVSEGGRGWACIGYHFVIYKDGSIHRGRKEEYMGAHTQGYNTGSIGISNCGNFDKEEPKQAQIDSLIHLIVDVCKKYDIPIDREHIKGHGEWDVGGTTCPGKNLKSKLDDIVKKAAELSKGGSTNTTSAGNDTKKEENKQGTSKYGLGPIELELPDKNPLQEMADKEQIEQGTLNEIEAEERAKKQIAKNNKEYQKIANEEFKNSKAIDTKLLYKKITDKLSKRFNSKVYKEAKKKAIEGKYGRSKYGLGELYDDVVQPRADYCYSWLTSEGGLSPQGACAGIGNMIIESGTLDPKVAEYGVPDPKTGKTYQPGNQVAEVTDTNMNIEPGQPGYGIFQFTSPGLKKILADYAKSKNISSGTIQAQLGAWKESFENPNSAFSYRKPSWDEMKTNKSPEELAAIWCDKLEIPNPNYANKEGRMSEARKAYDYYKDKKLENVKDPTGSGVASSNSNGGSSTSGGQQGGQNQNPFAEFLQKLSMLVNPFTASFSGGGSSGGSGASGNATNISSGGKGLSSVIGEGYDGGSPMGKPYRMSVHNSGGSTGTVEAFDSMHRGQGWACIGYHFVIYKDGSIHRGRKEEYMGAHTQGYNTGSIGVCLVGNFEEEEPTASQLSSLAQILADLGNKYNIPIDREHIKGHGEWDVGGTDCPGKNLKSKLDDIVKKAAELSKGGSTNTTSTDSNETKKEENKQGTSKYGLGIEIPQVIEEQKPVEMNDKLGSVDEKKEEEKAEKVKKTKDQLLEKEVAKIAKQEEGKPASSSGKMGGLFGKLGGALNKALDSPYMKKVVSTLYGDNFNPFSGLFGGFGSSKYGMSKYGENGDSVDTRKKYTWDWLVNSSKGGLNTAAASGVMSNIETESGGTFDPTIVEGGSHAPTSEEAPRNVGYGIVQYTDESRRQGLEKFSKGANVSSGSLDGQLGFIKEETTTGAYKGVWNKMNQQQDPVEAAKIWMDEFENPDPALSHWEDRRKPDAKKYFETFAQGKFEGGSATGGTSSGSSSGKMGGLFGKLGDALNKALDSPYMKKAIKLLFGDNFNPFASMFGGLLGGATGGATTNNNQTSNDPKADVPAKGNAKDAMQKALNNAPITSPYGERTLNGRHEFHNGIDFGIAEGTPLPALVDAVVDECGTEATGYGNYVVLKDKKGNYHIYGHLSDNTKVSKDQQVTKGTIIGLSGNTGASTGAHLHYGIYDANHPQCLEHKQPSEVGSINPSSYSIDDLSSGQSKYGLGEGEETFQIKPKFTRGTDAVPEEQIPEEGSSGDAINVGNIPIPLDLLKTQNCFGQKKDITDELLEDPGFRRLLGKDVDTFRNIMKTPVKTGKNKYGRSKDDEHSIEKEFTRDLEKGFAIEEKKSKKEDESLLKKFGKSKANEFDVTGSDLDEDDFRVRNKNSSTAKYITSIDVPLGITKKERKTALFGGKSKYGKGVLEDIDNMGFDELKELASKYNMDEVPDYNRIDFDKDDLGVVRSKLKAIIESQEPLPEEDVEQSDTEEKPSSKVTDIFKGIQKTIPHILPEGVTIPNKDDKPQVSNAIQGIKEGLVNGMASAKNILSSMAEKDINTIDDKPATLEESKDQPVTFESPILVQNVKGDKLLISNLVGNNEPRSQQNEQEESQAIPSSIPSSLSSIWEKIQKGITGSRTNNKSELDIPESIVAPEMMADQLPPPSIISDKAAMEEVKDTNPFTEDVSDKIGNLENMNEEELKDLASKVNNDNVDEYNRIDFEKDDLGVVRDKLGTIYDNYQKQLEEEKELSEPTVEDIAEEATANEAKYITGTDGPVPPDEEPTPLPTIDEALTSALPTQEPGEVATPDISEMVAAQNKTNELLAAILQALTGGAVQAGASQPQPDSGESKMPKPEPVQYNTNTKLPENDTTKNIRAMLTSVGGGSPNGMGDKFLGKAPQNAIGDIDSIINSMKVVTTR